MRVCVCPSQRYMLYRSDSADHRAEVLDMESAIGAGSDMAPPTPAFPISPPTPYGNRAEYKYAPAEAQAAPLTSMRTVLWPSQTESPTVWCVAVKNMSELNLHRQTPSPSLQSYGGYRTDHGESTLLKKRVGFTCAWSCLCANQSDPADVKTASVGT